MPPIALSSVSSLPPPSPLIPVVFLSPTPVDCRITPLPTHECAATAHCPDKAPTIVPLMCCRQRHRQRVGRRRRCPSNNNALPPVPHGCTNVAAPTTLHPHCPTKAPLPTSRRCPPPMLYASESIGRHSKAASSFIQLLCLHLPLCPCCLPAASHQLAIVADIERPHRQ